MNVGYTCARIYFDEKILSRLRLFLGKNIPFPKSILNSFTRLLEPKIDFGNSTLGILIFEKSPKSFLIYNPCSSF